MALAFPESEYQRRVRAVESELAVQGLDALIVTGPENICYLSGYWTPGYHVFQALVVRRKGDPFLVVRNIEADSVRTKSWIARFHPIDNLDRALPIFCEAMRAEGIERGRIGVEVDGARQSITRLDLLAEGLPGVTWLPSLDLVDRFRAVKSDGEIDYMRQAVRIAERALRDGADSLATARTDSDVAAAVHARLAGAGSEFTGSPPYIVGGKASALTHALHANRPLAPSDLVWMEVSASVNRYHGVASRIGGRDLPAAARQHFAVSAEAVQAMIKAMRPGVTAGAVDAVGRAVVEKHGMRGYWKNRAAYSLGLSFPPGLGEGHIIDIKPNDSRPLAAGMAFHLIPILKVPELGAIGCTETVVVRDGGGERLGSLPLEPLSP